MNTLKFVLREIKLPFRFTFTHSRASRKEGTNLILEIHHPNGCIGYGETLCRSYLTGETFESVAEDLKVYKCDLQGFELLQNESPSDFLKDIFNSRSNSKHNASFCAFDLAVYDLHAKIHSRKLSSYFPNNKMNKSVTVPIGINMPIIPLVLITALFGFREYKIKVSNQSLGKVIRLLSLLKGLGFNFRLDANEDWNKESIFQAISAIPNYISSIEQPTLPTIFEDSYANTRSSHTHLRWVADESIVTLADAHNLIALDTRVIWNLRLAKNGGITGVQTLIDLAQTNGVEYQLGVLVGETGLLASALSLFSATTNCLHLEYGFNDILLKTNPFHNALFPLYGKSRWSEQKSGFVLKSKVDLNQISSRIVEL